MSKEFYSIFYGRQDHLEDLTEAGKFDDAARLYAEQKDYFDKHMDRDRPLLKRVAEHFHGVHGGALATALRDLRDDADWPGDADTWPAKREHLASARAALDAYPDHAILRVAGFRDPAKAELEAELGRARGACEADAPAMFAGYDHFGTVSFFDTYPVVLDAKPFVVANFPAVAAVLPAARADQLIRFAENYRDLLTDTPQWADVSNAYLATALEGRGGEDAPDLVQVLGALRETQNAGFAPTRVPGVEIAFVDVTSPTLLKERQVEFAPQVDVDLPLAANRAALDEALAGDAATADFLIVFDIALARTDRRVAKIQRTPSRVLVGYKEEANPEYPLAQNRVNQAQVKLQSASINQISADSQYCYGMGCVAKAFGSLIAAAARKGAEEKLQQAMTDLANTPMTLKKPVYSKYNFKKATVKGAKTMTAHYYVIDRRRNRYFKETFDLQDAKTFLVAYEVHDDDPDREKHVSSMDTEQDVKEWEEAPVTIKLSQMVDQFVAHRGDSRKLPNLVALREEMLRDKNKALAEYRSQTFEGSTEADPRFDSVVVIYGMNKGLGSGFYVRPDVVMTNYHVVKEGEFVELKLYGGSETFGKVIARDAHLDLALIKVQARGKPVKFFDRNRLGLGSTVEVIGHPEGLDFSITRGVISAVRDMLPVNTVGSTRKVLHVQIDAAVSPGNSGGPVFLKDRVVSVVSFGKRDDGDENLNFTVHHSVAQRFIARALGAGT